MTCARAKRGKDFSMGYKVYRLQRVGEYCVGESLSSAYYKRHSLYCTRNYEPTPEENITFNNTIRTQLDSKEAEVKKTLGYSFISVNLIKETFLLKT